jgi:dTMP kinase
MDGVPVEFLAAINADVDVPDLAVILTADAATTAARIDARGTRHRFETGIASSIREAELYRDTTRRLAALGYPLLTIDTTHLRPDQVAERIAARIAGLTAGPTAPAATG